MIEKENYSLISGLKRIRQAENILDSTVIAGCSKEHENNRNDRNVFVFVRGTEEFQVCSI